MRILKLIPPVLVGLVLLCAAYFALVFSTPARAQECPLYVDQAVKLVQENGVLLSLVDAPDNAWFDQVLTAILGGKTIVALAQKGCMVTPPMPVAPAARIEGA